MNKPLKQNPVKEWAAKEFARVKTERGVTQSDLGRALGISQPQAQSLLSGSRKISVEEIPLLEQFFGVPFLYQAPHSVVTVPLISWVSAGQLGEQMPVVDLDDYPKIHTPDLPAGEWVALRVDGASMNKISPPDSIIFVNTNDTNLVPNALYVVTDEKGQATYKRYEPEEDPPFQPVSYKDIDAPELEGAIRVIGRVRRSMIDM